MVAIRLPVSVLWGCVCSLALFSMLSHFINREVAVPTFATARQIDFTPKLRDTPPENKRTPKPERKTPPPSPPGPTFRTTSGPTEVVVPYQPPTNAGAIPHGKPPMVGGDRDVIPLVRVPPDYPQRAIQRGIEGWVLVQFSVTAIGSVRDAKVVDADPKNEFEDAALKSIARWRYNPKVQDGVGVERVGLQTVIRFNLNQAGQ